MSKRDEVIAACAADLKDKCGVTADEGLLTAIVAGLGPSVYDPDASLVSSADPVEVERFKRSYCVTKLGIADGPELDAAIDAAFETYGRSNTRKRRAVMCYLMCTKFGKQGVYA